MAPELSGNTSYENYLFSEGFFHFHFENPKLPCFIIRIDYQYFLIINRYDYISPHSLSIYLVTHTQEK